MCAHHMKFVARTVLVRNNDVEAAYRALDRLIIWGSTGVGCYCRHDYTAISKMQPAGSCSGSRWLVRGNHVTAVEYAGCTLG